jgi:hypothetical protein
MPAFVDLLTGNQVGTISTKPPNNVFSFQCIPAPTTQVTITGSPQFWFSPNTANLQAGQTSVQVTATAESPAGGWNYILTGMNEPYAAHIVVGDSTPAREKKAS